MVFATRFGSDRSDSSAIGPDTPRDTTSWRSTKTIRYGEVGFQRSAQYTESRPDTTTAFKTHTLRYGAETKAYKAPPRTTLHNTIYNH